MAKITFMGAGSTVFAKNILGDCMLSAPLQDAHLALYDIDGTRLEESRLMLETLNRNINSGRAVITAHLGVDQRREALSGADYVVNCIQVGGYDPATIADFEIPKRYGLRQTIGDTLGIGGIFRALRTLHVMFDFARDMEELCPDAWMREGVARLQWKIAGINHQAWLLEITDGGRDLYPEIKERAAAMLAKARPEGGEKYWDMVRHYLMLTFGYYITESSEHSSEYLPYFIKQTAPELISEFNIPLDEYPRRCVAQIEGWKKQAAEIVHNRALTHTRTHEYGSYIMEAMETDIPFRIGGNVLNRGIITNLPRKAAVEVACLVDRNGVQPCVVGDLPEQCAALNRTNINPQILTAEAAISRRKDSVYHAAMLDPHTSSELTIDQIRSLCDDLIEAHGDLLPRYT
jgi:alpha-galactosidase